MKKLLIIIGVIILVFLILYIFVIPPGLMNGSKQSRFNIWINGDKSNSVKTIAHIPGSSNQLLEDLIKDKKTCEKLGKKWIQPNCIKAPCPGQCI